MLGLRSPSRRYIRNAVVDSPPVLLGDKILLATVASVSFVVPIGYDILLLSWSNVYVTDDDLQNLELTLVGGAGEYDHSFIALGTASSTTNAQNLIRIGQCGDDDAVKRISAGYVTIFNRLAQEKVVIGLETGFYNSAANGTDDDVFGYHIEAKDRTTDEAISAVIITASNSKLFAVASRFTLLGIATKDGR